MKSNRRTLLKNAAIGGGLLAGLGLTACTKKTDTEAPQADSSADDSAAATALAYVTAENSTAKALGYVEDASSLGSDVRADKGATKGADQFCTNCQFYTSVDGNGGKCSLFPGKLVKGKGWCRSWSLKAQV